MNSSSSSECESSFATAKPLTKPRDEISWDNLDKIFGSSGAASSGQTTSSSAAAPAAKAEIVVVEDSQPEADNPKLLTQEASSATFEPSPVELEFPDPDPDTLVYTDSRTGQRVHMSNDGTVREEEAAEAPPTRPTARKTKRAAKEAKGGRRKPRAEASRFRVVKAAKRSYP